MNVSSLNDQDIQSCLEAVPPGMRSNSRRRGRDPQAFEETSIFELIENNVVGPSLKDRFRSVLDQLEKADPQLRDLLVMMSYVAQCRTPVSMDMLIAFLEADPSSYKDIVALVERLGGVIKEYAGSLVQYDQDYYVIRSTIIAEAVMRVVTDPVFAEVFRNFHHRVTHYHIPNYEVFRTRAYDHRLAARVFPDPAEGREFYEKLFVRDRRPYTLQHGALYLAKKKQYPEAFELIDRAKNIEARRNWTIYNSYAIILFRANIEHVNEPEAYATLCESMRILVECYKSDRRKEYVGVHADIRACDLR